MTCLSPDARITSACPGPWNDEHEGARKRIVDYVHTQTDAKIALQLGHVGRQGIDAPGVGRDRSAARISQLAILSASPLPYIEGLSQISHEASRADMGRIQADFVAATARAITAGFDWIEFHCAHGYLMLSSISPLTTQRTHQYGGSLENRCRYPVEVFKAMRAVWPEDKPMSVRISGHDWVPGGLTP